MTAAEVARLEREAARMAPQVREILAALEDVAAGRAPRYLVAAVLERRGQIRSNPARHGHDWRRDVDTGGGVFVARCRCGWQSPACAARADDDGDTYPGDLWAAVAVDVHAAEANAGVPLWVFTPEGERFARQARRFGMPGGVR